METWTLLRFSLTANPQGFIYSCPSLSKCWGWEFANITYRPRTPFRVHLMYCTVLRSVQCSETPNLSTSSRTTSNSVLRYRSTALPVRRRLLTGSDEGPIPVVAAPSPSRGQAPPFPPPSPISTLSSTSQAKLSPALLVARTQVGTGDATQPGASRPLHMWQICAVLPPVCSLMHVPCMACLDQSNSTETYALPWLLMSRLVPLPAFVLAAATSLFPAQHRFSRIPGQPCFLRFVLLRL